MKKTGIITVVVIVGVLIGGYLWLNQAEPKYTGPVEKITVAAAEYLTGALVYVAEDQGFFKKNGLDATIKHYDLVKHVLMPL